MNQEYQYKAYAIDEETSAKSVLGEPFKDGILVDVCYDDDMDEIVAVVRVLVL